MSSPNLQILFPLLQHIFMYGKIISPTEEVIKMKKTIKRWTAGVLVAAITFSGPVMPAEAKGKLAKPEIKQVTSESAGKLKVLYKKVPKQAKAQVQVSTDKKFKKNVRSKVARGTVKSITFKKLKAVTYYVRVRSFVTEKKKKMQ